MDDREDQKRWRQALQLVGRTSVQELLRKYPGLPSDPVYDLPLEPPYPPREFCHQWCADSDLDVVKGYRNIIVVGVLFAVVGFSCALCTLSSYQNSTGPSATAPNQGSTASNGATMPSQASPPPPVGMPPYQNSSSGLGQRGSSSSSGSTSYLPGSSPSSGSTSYLPGSSPYPGLGLTSGSSSSSSSSSSSGSSSSPGSTSQQH